MRTVHVLEQDVVLKAPLDQIFEFFSKAENLQKLTPATMSFEMLTPSPVEMKAGAIIDYRIRLLRVPFLWKTEITEWQPPQLFADNQKKGPYVQWLHTHRFAAQGELTAMNDHVQYVVPGGLLEPVIHTLFVRPQVAAIFEFRTRAMADLFGVDSAPPPRFSTREQ